MKPAPHPDPDTAAFWAGCRRHELLAQQCARCHAWRWPPRSYCPSCHARDTTWERLDGAGTLVAFVVLHRAFDPAFANDLPLVVGHVCLDGTDGQVILYTNVVECSWEDVAVGMRVAVVFEERGQSVVPLFRPLPSS